MYIYVFIYLSYNREAVTMYSLHEDDLRRQFDVDYCIFENLRWLRPPCTEFFLTVPKVASYHAYQRLLMQKNSPCRF